MNFNYSIYGLNIQSSRQIKLLKEIHGRIPDLSVRWVTNPSQTPDGELNWEAIQTNGLNFLKRISFFHAQTSHGIFYKLCFTTENGSLFIILEPNKNFLWLVYPENEPETNLESYFIGIIIGSVLRLRGVLCLHASVVEIDDKAVIFLGKKKSGKSTTAAAFAKLGYRVLSDDIATITLQGNNFYIEPGYAKVRLRPKSLSVIHPKSNHQFLSVFSHRDSLYSDIDNNFCEKALPLAAIYQLGETAEPDALPFIEPISTQRIITLHQNTFAGFLITPHFRKKEFELLSLLTLQIPIRRLCFGRQVEMVNLQCQAVIDDFASINDQTINLSSYGEC